jgi:oxidase EvaA
MNNNIIESINSFKFLKSALTTRNPFNSTAEIFFWLNKRNTQVSVEINRIAFQQMRDWSFEKDGSAIRHNSGKFFSIEGIRVKTNKGLVKEWDQPIINQPEIGFLGIITKEFDGVLYFLMQAKIEPGNINNVQISPTLQATKSNYSQVHGGKKPKYLEFFQDRNSNEILLDQLQSEQGARFLKKRNRNIIIRVSGEIDVLEGFCWLTLGQIKELMRNDNIINMDTRTVVSGIPYGQYNADALKLYSLMSYDLSPIVSGMFVSELISNKSLNSFDDIIHWFTNLKSDYELEVSPIRLKDVRNWQIDDSSMSHEDGKYFNVIAVDVSIGDREVTSWNQPLIEPLQEGICGFIVKEIRGIYHFIVQAKLESGNFDILELAPTVQCITGSYNNEESLKNIPFLNYTLEAKKEDIISDTLQSEEGGRFFQEQNRNVIILAQDDFQEELPSNYIWMTLGQLKTLIKFNNFLNIQARSLIASISFINENREQ